MLLRSRPLIFVRLLLEVQDEVIGAVPVFDHLESVVDFLTQRFVVQEATEKHGLDGLSQFDNSAIGGMLIITPGKPLEDRLGIRSP